MATSITATNIIFDNVDIRSRFGLMPCEIGGNSGVATTSTSSNIKIDTVKTINNELWVGLGSSYEKPLTISFDLCKKDNSNGNYELDYNLIRAVSRLFSQVNTGYRKLQFCNEENADIYYFVKCTSFEKITVGGSCIGFRVELETNSPYGLTDYIEIPINMTSTTTTFNFMDYNDEVNKITYPIVTVDILEDCNFEINNEMTGLTTKIDNCVKDEVLTLDFQNMILKSNKRTTSELIESYNDVAFAYTNTYRDICNKLNISGMANIVIKTRFSRKAGV